MAFTGNYLCASYLKELLTATHNHAASGGDVFKLALYTNSATLNASTTAYSATNEISGTGYSAGGVTLTNTEPAAGSSNGYTCFSDVTISNATITARGGLIYNSSKSNKAVMVIDFGADKAVTGLNFTIDMPAMGASTALIRLGS